MGSSEIIVILFSLAFCFFTLAVIGIVFYFVARNSRKQTAGTRPPAATSARQTPSKAGTAAKPAVSASKAAPAPGPARGGTPAKPRASVGMSNIRGTAGQHTPVYLTVANKPLAILESMDGLDAQAKKANAARTKWSKVPRLFFFGGLFLIAIDGLLYLFGYPSCIFSIGAAGVWAAAIFLSVSLKRHQVHSFPPRYGGFREIIHTLRDDLRPDSTFLGHLDLTGAKQPSKVAREASDAQNRTTQYFRDEWLNLKAKLYDGNILRVSGIQRVKERKSYWKRSRISGKMKLKPAKFKGSYQELKVRIVVNPQVYKIVRNKEIEPGKTVGQYTISTLDTEGGMVTMTAAAGSDEVTAASVLNVLRSAYSLLQRKAA
ncbi:MAG: hypothetical protein ACOYZ8_11010 [Chloroflexota bacterium]